MIKKIVLIFFLIILLFLLNKSEFFISSDLQYKPYNILKSTHWEIMPNTRKRLLSTVGSTGPYGLHSYCDWSIGCRLVNKGKLPKNYCWGNPNKLPKIIFISCSSFIFFYENIYFNIPDNHKYTVVIADEDCSIPNSTLDVRYDRKITTDMWNDIVNNKNINHIFATHLDIPASSRYSPIPVGFNPLEHYRFDIDNLLNLHIDKDIMNRPLKIKGCCRIREGKQWEDRRIVSNLAKTSWKKFSDWGKISKSNFFNEIQNYSFLYCPHGGGIDPNPKAFSAIYCCTIPIMKKFVNCEILYYDLPVVFIDDWKAENITLNKLYTWKNNLKHYFYDINKRNSVLEKLSTYYWFNKIKSFSF